MPSIKVLNKKIASLKNTRKITKAMKMIAATKLRRAQEAFSRSEPYAEKLAEVIYKVARSHSISHPLFEPHAAVKRVRVLLYTSDRGLCGAFNGNAIKKAFHFCEARRQAGQEVSLSFLGRRGHDFFRRRSYAIGEFYKGIVNAPSFADSAKIGDRQIADFLSGAVDEVHLVFNEYRSAISQVPLLQPLLPMAPDEHQKEIAETPFLFEPAPGDIFNVLVYRAVKLEIFRGLLSSAAGEHAARMTAMDAAAGNCGDLIDEYTLRRNRARQASITKELIEIVSGAESLKG